MRLLYAGLPDAGDGGAGTRAGHQPTTSCSMFWRRTSAAAPATRTSSRRFAPRRPRCGPSRARSERRGSRGTCQTPEKSLSAARSPALRTGRCCLGRGRFAADVSFAGQLYMRVVRSTHANARLLSIDTAAARDTPGVHAVWTAADVADIPPIDFRLSKIAGLEPLPPARPGQRPGALCGRPGRGGVCRGSLSCGGRRRPDRAGARGTAGAVAGRRGARRIRAGPLDRGGPGPQGIRRPRCGLPQRARDGVAGASRRASFRRADRDPRRHRAL